LQAQKTIAMYFESYVSRCLSNECQHRFFLIDWYCHRSFTARVCTKQNPASCETRNNS